MTYTDNSYIYASKEHLYSPQTPNGYNSTGETGDYLQLNYNNDISNKSSNDINNDTNNYGHVRQEWYNDMAYYWHLPNPAFPAPFYGGFPTPLPLSSPAMMYYPPPSSTSLPPSPGETRNDGSFIPENNDNLNKNGSYWMAPYDRITFYPERRFIELPCEYEYSQFHENYRSANYINTDNTSSRNYYNGGGNVPFGSNYRYFNDNFSKHKPPSGLRHNRSLNGNWRRSSRGSSFRNNYYYNHNNYNYRYYYNSPKEQQEQKQKLVIASLTTPSSGFEKLPVDILTIIVQYAFPNPASSPWLTDFRLLSKNFNKATLNFLILARPQSFKKVVCILCGYTSPYVIACPPRDRNGCGRMCFNCYKPTIYKLLDSRVNFKTIQELSVFRNRFFDSMGKLEWFEAIPWNHDYTKNNKLVRWITFNRMKDYVEKYYQHNGKLPMTLTITKQGVWVVIEKSP
ncbi:13050_t:CDS:2 [Ambispora gerdemannii]|uniref:13050_t:CDS:1 n=1 Tax=Ambispora gerdemannii TaxID=144530 RepID=A0A9N8YI47_9GLOM|nr:13050_t:CDS:2 [Ambispora gerdemannii]